MLGQIMSAVIAILISRVLWPDKPLMDASQTSGLLISLTLHVLVCHGTTLRIYPVCALAGLLRPRLEVDRLRHLAASPRDSFAASATSYRHQS